MNKETIFILLGLAFVVFAFWFAITYSYPENATNSTDILCDKIMYSDQWTLGYLREIVKLCSNGG